ncbi:MAG: glycosyltransferase family 39 protein [Verrucomicrobia bacterium]|nr:glycosyltransferase family 39 protein [Verrucomicrobiota bacterium]
MKTERRYLLVLAALALLYVVAFFSETWQTGDDARYYGAALALVKGEGYTASYLPDSPPENLTPPAHPLLIAASMKVFGVGVLPGKILGALLFVVATILCFAWALDFFKRETWFAFCATAAGMFTLGLLSMSSWYMAEMSYLCGAFSALLLFDRAEARGFRASSMIAAGLVVGFAYLSRGVGLSLLAAAGTVCLIRRRWLAAIWFGVGFALLAVPWMVRNIVVVGSLDGYVPHYAGMTGAGEHGMRYPWMRVFHDVSVAFPKYFVQDLPSSFFFGLLDGRFLLGKLGLGFLAEPIRFLLLGLILFGFALRLRRPGVTEFYWVFYWLIISAPPFPPQGNWYVYPMLPLAAAYLINAIRAIAQWFPAPAAPRIAYAGAFAVLTYNLATASVGGAIHFVKELPRWKYGPWEPARYFYYENEYYDAWARFVEAGQWVASNLPPTTLIASRQAQQMYLMVGRQGWRYDLAQVPGTNLWDRMQRFEAQGRPVALIEDAFKSYEGATFSYGVGHWAYRDLFEHHLNDLELVYSTEAPVTRVWVMRSKAPEAEADQKP